MAKIYEIELNNKAYVFEKTIDELTGDYTYTSREIECFFVTETEKVLTNNTTGYKQITKLLTKENIRFDNMISIASNDINTAQNIISIRIINNFKSEIEGYEVWI